MGAVKVRSAVVVLIVLGGEVRGARVVRRRVDEADARESWQSGWGDVRPALAAIASDVCQAVVATGPDDVHVERRSPDGEDCRIDLGPVHVVGNRAPGLA